MASPNKRVVQRRDDGNFEVRKPGATRASAVTPTQREGVSRARKILGNDGGGELQIRGLNGQIRAQDTVDPGWIRAQARAKSQSWSTRCRH
ncbi:DUF2188 domain-containing protein [Nocardioides sp. SOB77]|uniref:DUF2188 domain-containing protein n=1 Tax=Nocardioides oceani TaxID=3058369 RepID=A0ABT8FMK1_9ACTN|nr:DUF2188 domain-containing protein [Nocardioides oceani]MDN4175622.1 DUF2188 domain-containing protein [Nocardioides oceani]